MKEKVKNINLLISEKRDGLKQKADVYFSSIIGAIRPTNLAVQTEKKSIPPISYILYGVAAFSALGTVFSESKLLCSGLGLACAFAGYRLAQNAESSSRQSELSAEDSLNNLKTDVPSMVLNSIKKITNEWDGFMTLEQKEIQSLINDTPMDEDKRDTLITKVFMYEVIDISIAEFSSAIQSAQTQDDIK